MHMPVMSTVFPMSDSGVMQSEMFASADMYMDLLPSFRMKNMNPSSISSGRTSETTPLTVASVPSSDPLKNSSMVADTGGAGLD